MRVANLGLYGLISSAVILIPCALGDSPMGYGRVLDSGDSRTLPAVPKASLPELPSSADSYEKRMQQSGPPPLPDDLKTSSSEASPNFMKDEAAWEKHVEKREVGKGNVPNPNLKGWLVHPKKDAWFGTRWMRSRLNRL
jgi:hypothetical protein